jgi:hypothetical protein
VNEDPVGNRAGQHHPVGFGDDRALEVFLSGFSARYLYRQGRFPGHLSFEELRTPKLAG